MDSAHRRLATHRQSFRHLTRLAVSFGRLNCQPYRQLFETFSAFDFFRLIQRARAARPRCGGAPQGPHPDTGQATPHARILSVT